MRKIVCLTIAGAVLAGCSVDYEAEPVTPHTPDSVPACFMITRDDDGVKDGIGPGPLGIYCRNDEGSALDERLGITDEGTTTTTDNLGYP